MCILEVKRRFFLNKLSEISGPFWVGIEIESLLYQRMCERDSSIEEADAAVSSTGM